MADAQATARKVKSVSISRLLEKFKSSPSLSKELKYRKKQASPKLQKAKEEIRAKHRGNQGATKTKKKGRPKKNES